MALPQHEYFNGVCGHCGDKESDNANNPLRLCKRVEPENRPIPTSVFAEIDPIHARILELRAERDAQLAGTTSLE